MVDAIQPRTTPYELYNPQSQAVRSKKAVFQQVSERQRAQEVDIFSNFNKNSGKDIGGNDALKFDLGSTLANIQRVGDTETRRLNASDNGIATGISVSLTKVSNDRVYISISGSQKGNTGTTGFVAHLNDDGSVRGFDTNGTGQIDRVQSPQIKFSELNGKETRIQLNFLGSDVTSGQVQSDNELSLESFSFTGIRQITSEAILAYNNPTSTTTETTTDSSSSQSGNGHAYGRNR